MKLKTYFLLKRFEYECNGGIEIKPDTWPGEDKPIHHDGCLPPGDTSPTPAGARTGKRVKRVKRGLL